MIAYYGVMGLLLIGLVVFAKKRKEAAQGAGGRKSVQRAFNPFSLPESKKKKKAVVVFELSIDAAFEVRNMNRARLECKITKGKAAKGDIVTLATDDKVGGAVEKIERKGKELDVAKRGRGYEVTVSGFGRGRLKPGDKLVRKEVPGK